MRECTGIIFRNFYSITMENKSPKKNQAHHTIKKSKQWGWSIVSRTVVLHVDDLESISGTKCGPLSCELRTSSVWPK